ncbi:MAG: serine/threonine-protein kinase [Kofleriaceae bacterium]
MGEVWRGTDLQLGREVAVKLLLPRVITRVDGVARFEREARVGATFMHPNVVHTLDFGRDGETSFLVLELVEGGTLWDVLSTHRVLPMQACLTIAYQIADVLAAAHRIGLVHRDLKPDNILLDRSNNEIRIKVADFGMAFLIEPEDPRQGRITRDGSGAGTPEYMAPEQSGSGILGPAVDVYALGCVLYELVAGDPPFMGSVGKVIAAHLYGTPPRLEHSAVPLGLDDLVARMLAKRPEDRPTADAVRRRLALIGGEWLDSRSRARDGGVVSDRAARMLPTTPPPIAAATEITTTMIAVVGTSLSDEHRIALTAAGYVIGDVGGARAIVMFGASLDALQDHVRLGPPIVADADSNDFHRLSELLRIGIADVALRPVSPSALVHKLARVVRKPKEV